MNWRSTQSFVPLLAMLLVIMVAVPFTWGSPLASLVLTSGLLLACIPALQPSPRLRLAVTAGLVVVMAIRLLSARRGIGDVGLAVAGLLATAAYVAFITASLFVAVVRRVRVNANTIMGAICVYVMVAHVFALLYLALEVYQPGSIAGPGLEAGSAFAGGTSHVHGFLYFSVITLTTLGFGDVVPVTPTARVLTMLEAMSGQLFMAVFVARLVGSWGTTAPPADGGSAGQ